MPKTSFRKNSDSPLPGSGFSADAVDEGMDVGAFVRDAERTVIKVAPSHPCDRDISASRHVNATSIPLHSLGELLADTSPMPDDLIAPRVLTPGGMIVFGGAPKVGKSNFLLSWLTHMAAGEPFLELTPSRPLRVFYLQAEVQYHYLRERIQSMGLSDRISRRAAAENPGIEALQRAAAQGGVDVLVIDPIRNVFDGGPEGNSENDNNAMRGVAIFAKACFGHPSPSKSAVKHIADRVNHQYIDTALGRCALKCFNSRIFSGGSTTDPV
jgi:hypothetical protein